MLHRSVIAVRRHCLLATSPLQRLPYRCWEEIDGGTTVVQRNLASAIDKLAENQIAEWLRNKGDQALPHGKKLTHDVHKAPAHSLGLQNDYVHSKILADNNIRPDSVQRRIDLDKSWHQCADMIREQFSKSGLSADDFISSSVMQEGFRDNFDKLNAMAKRVNDAIIDDSMRFGGRSPVRHARSFRWEERAREAIEDCRNTSERQDKNSFHR
ncbi:hypothetical protein IV203_012124 [Nitzschia inconspicua]|uniref:Uncharacterized protein n=1 Tax=Nitzschia inconspicua TaxID=303405 RepID=A0A9K3PJ22_9STRA|nr:hypothetical protein IV203_012124 [Nitzschia inconspicua]